jgi:isochorismate synthase
MNLPEIIKELHPTSAVCGLPKPEAMSFILEHEHYNREYYSGFLGELNVKSAIHRRRKSLNQEQLAIKSIKTISDLHVNLRCMKVSESYVEIYVGGGITADSQPEAEYLETVAKSQTLLNVL